MKVHEYQGKELFKEFGIPVQRGLLAFTPEEAENIARKIEGEVVVKAQVHAGGRGKAGGVKLVGTPKEAYSAANKILGMDIKGITVRKLLIEESVDIDKEYYVGLTIDRSSKKIVFMVSREGGIEIEEVAANTPEKIIKVFIDPVIGLKSFQIKELSQALFDGTEKQKAVALIFGKLYKLFIEKDCSLAEINPLVLTKDGEIVAIDSKVIFDNNAITKHPELHEMIDLDEEDVDELEAREHGLSFIKLNGKIGCIVNGAGLAMATMDIIKLFGGEPANFLDVGGSSSPDKITKAFELILKNKKVKAVLINIFGGITRCDDIAEGLILAKKNMNINVPVIIRLTGNNIDKAKTMLDSAGLSIYQNLEDAVKAIAPFF